MFRAAAMKLFFFQVLWMCALNLVWPEMNSRHRWSPQKWSLCSVLGGCIFKGYFLVCHRTEISKWRCDVLLLSSSLLCILMSKKFVEDKTTGMRLMYVGMLLLYSCACNDGEPVSCRSCHRMWFHFLGVCKKKRKRKYKQVRFWCLQN